MKTTKAHTIVVRTRAVLEIFNFFRIHYLENSSITWRSMFGTPAVLIAAGAVIVLQLIFTHALFMGAFFETGPVGVMQTVQLILVGIAVLVILEIETGPQSWIVRRPHGPGGDSQKTAQNDRRR